jgi:hypothetical protein
MKYIKKFETIISNSSNDAQNHPLYELAKHIETILKKIKNIDKFEKSITRIYFSKKRENMNITINYSCDGYRLVDIELIKFENMNNVGMRVETYEKYRNIDDMRNTSDDFLKILKDILKSYYTRTNRESIRFDFNLNDLNDIMYKLNIEEIVEELKLRKDANKYNL